MKQEPRVVRRPKEGKPEPSLPHEQDQDVEEQSRDQTLDDQMAQSSYEDAKNGAADTGTQPVIEETDRKLRGSRDH